MLGYTPWAETPLGRHPPQQTATAADSTHPTGMHSCTVMFFINNGHLMQLITNWGNKMECQNWGFTAQSKYSCWCKTKLLQWNMKLKCHSTVLLQIGILMHLQCFYLIFEWLNSHGVRQLRQQRHYWKATALGKLVLLEDDDTGFYSYFNVLNNICHTGFYGNCTHVQQLSKDSMNSRAIWNGLLVWVRNCLLSGCIMSICSVRIHYEILWNSMTLFLTSFPGPNELWHQ